MPPIERLFKRVKNAAELFLKQEDDVLFVFSHNDADGLTSAAIITYLCEKTNKLFHLRTFKQLRPKLIRDIEENLSPREAIFVDFGSGQLTTLSKRLKSLKRIIILDHHVPEELETDLPFRLVHVNPRLFGFSGDKEISSSGVSYLLAHTLAKKMRIVKDLSPLAITGALGDNQLNEEDKLIGLNRLILREAKEKGVIQEKEEDLRLAAKEYKPLYKALATTFHPVLPGISGSPDAALNFLKDQFGERKSPSTLMYSDLNESEKEQLMDSLVKRVMFTSERKVEEVRNQLFGVTYLRKEGNARLRDLQDFSTILNACSKLGSPSVGIRLALGERGETLEKAVSLHGQYRDKLSQLLKTSIEKGQKEEDIFIVRGREWMEENFASVIASILSDFKRDVKIIVVSSHSDEKFAKLSLRNSKGRNGEDLSEIVEVGIKDIDEASGGGHKDAAGAYIPYSDLEGFLTRLKSSL